MERDRIRKISLVKGWLCRGGGFFYSKYEFSSLAEFPCSLTRYLSFFSRVREFAHARAHVRIRAAAAHTRARAHAHVRALVSDDGAGNGVSDETELTQVDLPRRWRGAPDT